MTSQLLMNVNSFLTKIKQYSEHQFAIWRILFGVYATYFSLTLIPYTVELFSNQGIYSHSPTTFPFPNILYWLDAPSVVIGLSIFSAIACIGITIGYQRRLSALIAWYIHACWFGRNIFIEDPSMAYVGLLFILLAIIPSGEVWSFDKKRSEKDITWNMPLMSYWTALLALGIGYTISGLDKFQAIGWQVGDAMYYMLDLQMTRDNLIANLVKDMPFTGFQYLTWFAALGMLFALPGLLWKRSRFITWIIVTSMFITSTILFELTQVTLAMLLFHLFIFDRTWIPAKKANGNITLFYDTNCNLCQTYKTFIETEEHKNKTTFTSIRDRDTEFDSLILSIDGKEYTYSDSVLQHWHYLGGIWRVFAFLLLPIPKIIRDSVYKFVSKHRYKWFGTCDCE